MLDVNEILDEIIDDESRYIRNYVKSLFAEIVGFKYDQFGKISVSDELKQEISTNENVLKFKQKIINRISQGVLDSLINKKLLDAVIENLAREVIMNIRNEIKPIIMEKMRQELEPMMMTMVNKKLCEYDEIREHLITKKL